MSFIKALYDLLFLLYLLYAKAIVLMVFIDTPVDSLHYVILKYVIE